MTSCCAAVELAQGINPHNDQRIGRIHDDEYAARARYPATGHPASSAERREGALDAGKIDMMRQLVVRKNT
uniref:Uncharacterized protein n=1 Tax=Hyaloperonospora arabidopsidis (strain Emoy2) TaxID=559515 RepID=M4BPH0_HYAAE